MAAARDINVQTSELTRICGRVREENTKIKGALDSCYTDINLLCDRWQSPGADKLRQRFNGVAEVYNDKYYASVENYCQYLDNTAKRLQGAESAIQAGANAKNF